MATTQPTRGETYTETFDALEKMLQDDQDARQQLLDGVQANLARVDLEETLERAGIDYEEYLELAGVEKTNLQGVESEDEDAIQSLLFGDAGVLGSGENATIKFEAEWYGFRVTMPESAMNEIAKAENMTKAFMALGGAVAVASGGVAAAIVGIFAAYVVAEWEAMKYVDKGKGVYLHNTYASPGVVWPTAI